MIPLVVLCGGKGERMGRPKGLLDFHRRPWLEEQLRRFSAAGGSDAIIGLGHFAQRYLAALPWLESGQGLLGLRVAAVVNPEPERGPFSTLWSTLVATPSLCVDGVLVQPIDAPLAPPAVRLLAGSRAFAAVATHGGRGGHPVRLSNEAVLAALALDPASGRLDHFLRAQADRVERIAVDDSQVTMNLNSPEAWAAYTASANRGVDPPRD